MTTRLTTVLLLAGALSALPASAQTPPTAPSVAVKPGDDFDGYANAAWLAATAIPADKGNITVRHQVTAQTRAKLVRLLEDGASAPAGTYTRKAADFYGSLLQQRPVGQDGLLPLRPALARIAALRDKAGLAQLLGSGIRADIDPVGVYGTSDLFGLWVQAGFHGEKKYQPYLVQGGLALPDRDYYTDPAPAMQALRAQYRDYIATLLAAAGFADSAQRAAAVLDLETAIASGHATQDETGDDRKADNTWRRADFQRRAPGLDWQRFFAAAHLSGEAQFIVWQPGALTTEAALVGARPLDVWQDLLRFHLLDRYADLLPPAFADAALALRRLPGSGLPGQGDAAQRAYDATNRFMADAAGHMYVDAYPAQQTRDKVRRITADVINAFGKRIDGWSWMSAASKAQAHQKLRGLYFAIGYPDRWQNDAALTISREDPIGNLARASTWRYAQALAKLRRPVSNADAWFMGAQVMGARSQPEQKAYNLPAAFLQAPKFDPDGSDAANYGAIGAIIGHEIVHFFDISGPGAEYDARNDFRDWWQPQDLTALAAASTPLVQQYAQYRPFPDMALDGKVVLSETTADLGGLMAAFDAHRASLGARINDADYVREQDRQFFLGFAHSWQGKAKEATIRALNGKDSHPPERYRIATVRNLDAWYEAFGVQPGDALYLPPAARVRIW